jgi:hypothetical protein
VAVGDSGVPRVTDAGMAGARDIVDSCEARREFYRHGLSPRAPLGMLA